MTRWWTHPGAVPGHTLAFAPETGPCFVGEETEAQGQARVQSLGVSGPLGPHSVLGTGCWGSPVPALAVRGPRTH